MRSAMRRLVQTLASVAIVLSAVRAQSVGPGSIAGRVVDATTGAPLHRARVEIHPDGHNDIRGMAPTDGDGRFTLRSLPAGQYRIQVSRRGYATMAYGASRPNGQGRVLVLGAGEQVTDVTIRLPRLGVISGTVTGVDGEPLAQAQVQALRRQFARGKLGWTPWRFAQTDDQGRFRLFGLTPGPYLIAANKPSESIPTLTPTLNTGDPAAPQDNRLAYATTYAPGTQRRDEARVIELQPGQTLEDVEIPMQAVRPVKLSVQAQLPVQIPARDQGEGSPEGTPPPPIRKRDQPIVNLRLRDAPGSSGGGTNWGGGFEAGRTFEYQNLQPGQYELSGEVTIDGRLYVARQGVDLSGGDLEVTLDFTPAIALRGSLRLEGAGAAAGRQVHLYSGDGMNLPGANAEVQPDGSFVLADVRPGVWDIGVDPLPKDGYLKSMKLGDEDVLHKDMLITAETTARLEIVLSAAGAELKGQVEGAGATTVLLAPQGENAAVLAFYAVTGVDNKGEFHFRGRTPGIYKVYAFDEMDQGAWMDPNFLTPFAEQATDVELREGPNPDVSVHVIHNAAAGAGE